MTLDQSNIALIGRGRNIVSHDLSDSIDYLKTLLFHVIKEYDPKLAKLTADFIVLVDNSRKKEEHNSFTAVQQFIDDLSIHEAQMVARTLTCFFHLANLAEENYRVNQLNLREVSDYNVSTGNSITDAYEQLTNELGEEQADQHLKSVKFYPVLTAHPTEARRKAVSGKISRIGKLLNRFGDTKGVSRLEIERKIIDEIDAIFRTSPIALQKPTPLEESETVISTVEETLFDVIPKVMRRFDDIAKLKKYDELNLGKIPPIPQPFFELGSWIGSDRDGNPNVTATVTRNVADKFSTYIVNKFAANVTIIGRNTTLESSITPASDELKQLWLKLSQLDETTAEHIEFISKREPHRSCLLLIGKRLEATAQRNMDYGYKYPEDLLKDLRIVQDSLLQADAPRSAYGLLQTFIWQVEIFGFHLASMEMRQHSQVHAAAIAEINTHSIDSDELSDRTKEVIKTFQAIGAIQRKYGVNAVRRYIVSFTQETQHIADVYKLAALCEPTPELEPVLDVVPLFETMDDLTNSVAILEEAVKLPEVQRQIERNNGKIEVMLGYSDSSKDVGPVAATFALHSAQQRISDWAKANNLNLVLFHGRGGALGRGGGPAHRAVIAQPPGSVNGVFKITEQGESITARYANPKIAIRHIETIIGATLLNSAPSIEKNNHIMFEQNSDIVEQLVDSSKNAFNDLIQSQDFANWFGIVTPLEEIGLLPIGSRPAKRGLSTRSLEDLRAIPWVFSWSQARINLAAWYGFGSAINEFVNNGDRERNIHRLRELYQEWNLFSTLVDNIEMALAKTDERIALQYLSLSDRSDLTEKVITELRLAVTYVQEITNSPYLLADKKVLGQAVQIRGPYVDALSQLQFAALKKLRTDEANMTEQEIKDIKYLLLCTVSGVSAGLQNTG